MNDKEKSCCVSWGTFGGDHKYNLCKNLPINSRCSFHGQCLSGVCDRQIIAGDYETKVCKEKCSGSTYRKNPGDLYCTPKKENGHECSGNRVCLSGFCHDNYCRDTYSIGTVCNNDYECKSKWCINTCANIRPKRCQYKGNSECGASGCYGPRGLPKGVCCRYDEQCRSRTCKGNGQSIATPAIRNGTCK